MEKQIKEELISQNHTVVENIKVVYVVIRNVTKIKKVIGKTPITDEFTQIVRVCETEANAQAYVKTLKGGMNTSFYVIPTPFGDIDLEEKEYGKNE